MNQSGPLTLLTDTKYELEILQQCGSRVRIKSQKVVGANSYIWRNQRGKTGYGGLFGHPHPE